jgi:hypothetical protein
MSYVIEPLIGVNVHLLRLGSAMSTSVVVIVLNNYFVVYSISIINEM